MHSLLHTEYARTVGADLRDRHAGAEAQRRLRAKAPPGHLRVMVAHALGSAARRVDREVARRAVA